VLRLAIVAGAGTDKERCGDYGCAHPGELR
jgi:hypothetical protein